MPRWPILLCALLSASPVHAQTANKRSEVERVRAAAEEFDAGRRAFTAGDFTTAAEHFENADRDAPAPEALRMAIRARLAAKQPDRVATLAAAAIARYPNDEATVTFAKQTLAKVPKRLHRLSIRCDEACTLLVDRRLVPGTEATESTVYVEPGQHEITAGWSEGRTQSQNIDASQAGESELSFTAPALVVAEPEPEPETEPEPEKEGAVEVSTEGEGLPPVVFYGAVGLSTVLAGVTVWSTLDMRANPGKDKVREDCAGQDESCATYQDAISAQNRTNVLLVSTGIVAVGTAVLGGFFTDWSAPQDKTESEVRSRSVVPTLTVGQGVVVGASGTF
jgi:hypothetical protein